MGFWDGKTVVVTGGAGFLGSHICDRLRQTKAKLIIPDKKDYDLRLIRDVRKLFREYHPDTVIHLAATVGGIGANKANPGLFFYDNMAMGLNVIEEARQEGVRKIVVTGTVCAYPKMTPVPFKEENLFNGYPEETNAPYAIAKKALLVMLQAYRAQYGLNGIYLLPVNLYGPRDNFDLENSHVIPALIRKFLEAKDKNSPTVTCWGTGSASREFLYVEDCADAILLATEKYDKGDPVNIGVGSEITIKDLTHKIAACTEYKGEIVWDTTKPDGQPRRCLDTQRAQKYFGFTAQTPFEVGLKKTVDWYTRQRS